MNKSLVRIIIGLLLVVVLFVMRSDAVAAVTIPAGDCLNVSVNGSNESYCAGFPTRWEVEIDLEPGQSDVAEGDYCFVDAVCQPVEQEVDVCKKVRSLEPGEEYELVDGACDLRFTCEEDDDVPELEANYNVPASIVKTGDNLSITIDGEQVAWGLIDQDMNVDYEVPVVCPTDVTAENIDRYADETLYKWAMLINPEFYTKLSEKVLTDGERWAERVEKKDEEIIGLRLQLEDCESGHWQINATMVELGLANDKADDWQVKAETRGALLFGLSFVLIISLLGCGILLFLLVRKGGDV